MISLTGISKQYGRQILFVDASFQLNPGETVGLVGPNGSGKTTLFRLITGEEQPDEGTIQVPKKLTIGYFRQDVEDSSGRSVLDEAILGSGRVVFNSRVAPSLATLLKWAARDNDRTMLFAAEVHIKLATN